MHLNEKLVTLLEGLTAEGGGDWYSLQEAAHPETVMRTCDAIRRFLGIPGTTGGVRPGPEILAPLLGYGQAGALRIFEAFCSETLRTDAESVAAFNALRTIARRAQMLKLTSWNLDDVKIAEARGSKVLIAFDVALDQRLRAAAAARSESLSDFIREATRDRIAALERTRRRTTAGEREELTETAAAT